MNGRWRHGEARRMAVAVLLAVSMHVVLASLPVELWRPLAAAPPVLRVTLAVPAPVASVAPPAGPATAEPPGSRPPVEPVARLNPAPTPQAAPAPPAPPVKPQPRKPAPVERAAYLRPPSSKPLKPAEPPPAALKKPPKPPPVARAPARAPQQRPERVRPVKTVAASPDRTPWAEGAAEPYSGRNPLGRDGVSNGGGQTLEVGKTASGAFGRPTAVASAQPARPAATSLRPLPGNPPPRYPPLARQRGIEGRVLLRLTVNAGGGVEAVSIAQSSGDASLDQEAKQTVARWRFQPPGLAQAVAQVPIAFRLKD